MNRRAFLKLTFGATVLASIPVPNFLLKEEPLPNNVVDLSKYGSSSSVNLQGGVLTQEMIEEAAMKAAQNFGKPDMLIFPDEEVYREFAKFYKVKLTLVKA